MGKGGYGLTYQEVYEMENLTIEAKAVERTIHDRRWKYCY